MVLTDMSGSVSPQYDDSGIIRFMENCYADSITANQQSWAQGDIDLRQYTGDPSLWAWQYGNQRAGNGNMLSFNLSRRLVEAPCGYQRTHQKNSVAIPIENSDQKTADLFTKLLIHSDQLDDTAGTLSSAFTGANITGMNLVSVWLDYRDDPINGTIRTTNHAYNTFIIDPYFRQPDLSDCKFIWQRTFLTKAEALSLLPMAQDIVSSVDILGARDGKFPYMPEAFNFNMKGLMTYDQFTYRDFRKQKLLVDWRTNQQIEWKHDDSLLKPFLKANQTVEVIDQIIPTTRLAVVLQGRLVFHGPNPTGSDMFPYAPVLSYYTPDSPYLQWRVQGLLRCCRDAQYLYNRRKTIELDALESQLNSGWKLKEDSLIDPTSVYKTGQGQALWLKKDAQMTDVEKIPTASIDPSWFQVSETIKDLMMEMVGSNEAVMGSAVDDRSGLLEMVRQGAGLTVLQRLFSQLDTSQKIIARLKVDYMKNNYTPEKVMRITGENPTQEFYTKNFGKYDIEIEEGFHTSTQRQLAFSQAMALQSAGIELPKRYMIQQATLQNKTELLEMIAQEEQQAQQMQQAQAQGEQQTAQATAMMAQARAEADTAMAAERYSRISENKAMAFERLAEAHRDEQQAELNKAKTLKELESMDVETVQKAFAIAQQIQAMDHAKFAQHAAQQSLLMKQLEALSNSGMNNNAGGAQPPSAAPMQ